MSLSQPIMNLERTDTIPQESTFVVEMGDGAGTKAVTKETLTKEMGEALKVGNLEELQTEAKSSIVAAINEAAQSGGGGADVDILDTKEEIEANTEPGKAAGAQAVKEMFGALNDNLQGFTPVIDESTGKMTGYKTAAGGADTVFPFTGNCLLKSAHYISGFGTDSLPFTLNESYPIHISCEEESISSTYASAGIINVENMGATKIKLANGTGAYISAYSQNGKVLKRVKNTSELSLPPDTAFVIFMRNGSTGHVQYFTVS